MLHTQGPLVGLCLMLDDTTQLLKRLVTEESIMASREMKGEEIKRDNTDTG